MSQTKDYVEAFLTKKPKEGITIVQERLKDSVTLDKELAEYFKERAEIEEDYAKSLAKASKRLYTMDPGVLGHFAPIWELLLKEFNQVANYHSELAYRVSQEIEIPLRSPASQDYQALEQMEPIIHSIENKNRLSSVKGSIFKKSGKSTWETQGVEYLTLAQKMDESRLSRVKESVAKFEQIQSQQLMKRAELTKKTLSVANAFDIQHDIRDFCSERSKGLALLRPRSNSHDSQRSTTSSNKFKSVFMKKKKQDKEHSYSSDQHSLHSISESLDTTIPVATKLPSVTSTNESSLPNIQQGIPLVDAEGYSIPITTGQFPTIASDLSSRNKSDDLDSDFQRSSIIRSQTDSSLNSMYNDSNMANSVTSLSSLRSSTSNPFLQSQQSTSPSLSNTTPFSSSPQQVHTPTSEVTTTNWQLQPIMEDQQPDLHFSIHEKTNMIDKHHQLVVDGQVFVTYTGQTNTPIQINPFQIQGIQQLIPNPQYITSTDQNYIIETNQLPQGQAVLCFTYRVSLNGDGRIALPIRLLPSWKCVDGISYLMIKHNRHPLVKDVKGSVHVFYDKVNSVQSTPQGTWQTETKCLTWQLEDLLHQYEQQEGNPRLLAKFLLEENHVGTIQPIHFNYLVKGALVTGFTIDLVDNQPLKQTLETTVQSENILIV
ncbi:hypothetical protein INT48_001904 [Thamnidium elegans]|uniref:FCH domain-containing protein n=1 Tax=Thamnidium elegans TaxID=101142 RepID=A0A8H7SJK9_9FUNG|nr:hypothetical protein INT48_001904 [Thamnidium elegans]